MIILTIYSQVVSQLSAKTTDKSSGPTAGCAKKTCFLECTSWLTGARQRTYGIVASEFSGCIAVHNEWQTSQQVFIKKTVTSQPTPPVPC